MENMRDVKIKFEYLPVKDLEPYAKNTRKHGEDDIEEIKKSIQESGFCDPIGVWSDHNVIVEGHGRLMAAKALGYEEVPVIHLDHLTDIQRREYAIKHNWTAEQSTWDEINLKSEYEELQMLDIEFDMDLGDFGFQEEKTSAVEDDFDEEPPEEPSSKYGQVYSLGGA